MLKNVCFLLIGCLGVLLLGGTVCFGMAWALLWLLPELFIGSDVVKDTDSYWYSIKVIYVILVTIPILWHTFKMLPSIKQEAIKESTTALGVALLHIGNILSSCVLICFGGFLFYVLLI